MAKTAKAQDQTAGGPSDAAKSSREAIESIVIAIVLAFLFRAFEAEAFVIPTGSMAPTLQGRHKDVECPQCGYQYQAGASLDLEGRMGEVVATTCPMCFYTEQIDRQIANHASHTGDRILVNKFAYEAPFGEPERWDVIVFKYPGNAKQNYIKRLVGLPNEVVKIFHGDIFVRPTEPGADAQHVALDDPGFEIARKSPDKLKHMLQLVHDTHYLSSFLQEVNWPLNWQSPQPESSGWVSQDAGVTYSCTATPEMSWLHFRQYHLDFADWQQLLLNGSQAVSSTQREIPVTDFYAYNAQSRAREGLGEHPRTAGLHWVGDLAVEADVSVDGNEGLLVFELIEAGRKHRCQFDIASGQATLSIDGGRVPFQGSDGREVQQLTAQTQLKGAGTYDVRFANVDNQLVLWVNDRVVSFESAATYPSTPGDRPQSSADDPGDLHPVRVAAQRCAVTMNRLRVLRDIYYIATDASFSGGSPIDYDLSGQVPPYRAEEDVYKHLINPQQWRPGDYFDRRQAVAFSMADDQFFPLGDNSPYSRDGRMWGWEHYVERDLLIGEAVLIYWPHAWRVRIPGIGISIPLIPHVGRMGRIH